MQCPSCTWGNQVEFRSEIIVHFNGLRNLDKPGVWLFLNLLVCLDCGFAWFTVPKTELELIGTGERLTVSHPLTGLQFKQISNEGRGDENAPRDGFLDGN
jgi:hypothetical protein